VVKTRLLDVDKVMALAEGHHKKIVAYHDKAEDYLKAKDAVKEQLEKKLEKLVELYGNQKEEASDRNTTIMQCHEKILKAMKLCEHKIKERINDPKRTEKKVDALIKDHKYWQAYAEVNRALAEDSKLEDNEIIDELTRWQQLIQDFEQQFRNLEVTPTHIEDFKRMLELNHQLTIDKAALISMRGYNKCLEELDECRADRDAERDAKEKLQQQLADSLRTAIVVNIIENAKNLTRQLHECREQLRKTQENAEEMHKQLTGNTYDN
jgi:hypothetical protein